jgi:hypothetical protein
MKASTGFRIQWGFFGVGRVWGFGGRNDQWSLGGVPAMAPRANVQIRRQVRIGRRRKACDEAFTMGSGPLGAMGFSGNL